MITFETFLLGLLVISTLTGLATEAVKKVLLERKIKYKANTLVGIIATCLSIAISIGYVIMTGIAFSAQIVVCIIALTFMSWLCAMVGYDKVIQTITSFKTE
jgi:predicted membrane metal-binding protein